MSSVICILSIAKARVPKVPTTYNLVTVALCVFLDKRVFSDPKRAEKTKPEKPHPFRLPNLSMPSYTNIVTRRSALEGNLIYATATETFARFSSARCGEQRRRAVQFVSCFIRYWMGITCLSGRLARRKLSESMQFRLACVGVWRYRGCEPLRDVC
jgi:hypothetical protein